MGDERVLTPEQADYELMCSHHEAMNAERVERLHTSHEALRASLAEARHAQGVAEAAWRTANKWADDLRQTAMKRETERDALRAEVERLMRERDEARETAAQFGQHASELSALLNRNLLEVMREACPLCEKAAPSVTRMAEAARDAALSRATQAESELQSHLESTDGVRRAIVRAQEDAAALRRLMTASRSTLYTCVAEIDEGRNSRDAIKDAASAVDRVAEDLDCALAAGPVDDPAKEAVEVLADVLCAEVNLVMLIAGVASLVTVRDLLSEHHPEKLARAEAVIARRKP